MQSFQERRILFEKNKKIYESVKLKFNGVDGYDVYNGSIPFIVNGEQYIYGRVEKRSEWARSWSMLFKQTGQDEYTRCDNSMIYHIEDPYISFINNELIMGGTYVIRDKGDVKTYYANFYKGTDLHNLYYFTSGPDNMKDIRLVQMNDKIGVFSRPRDEETQKKYGSDSIVGFTTINSMDELDEKTIEQAPIIPNMFNKGEWGGANQCYLLDTGLIGIIGHKCYKYQLDDGKDMNAYINVSFVIDPSTRELVDEKIIGTRSCYPDGPTKIFLTTDSTFTSGIVVREDGKVDLYSGLSDTEIGRCVIDNPFLGFGKIITKNTY